MADTFTWGAMTMTLLPPAPPLNQSNPIESIQSNHINQPHPTHPPTPQPVMNGAIFVQDAFLDAQAQASLVGRFAADAVGDTCRKELPVARSLSDRILAILTGGGRTAAAPSATAATAEAVVLPTFESFGDHREHQDQYPSGPRSGQVVDGRVGLLYLEGDGDFVLTETATGAEHRVPIAPGKLISWPNAAFTHRVEGATPCLKRRSLGPMTFDASSASGLAAVGIDPVLCPDLDGYKLHRARHSYVQSGTDP